jgi:anti-sigma factor (TIGR02949 family)
MNNPHSDVHNCKNLLASISEFVDGDLPADLCAELEKHLAECENCRIVVNTLRKTIELYQECEEDQPMPNAARERLLTRLHLEGLLK